MKQNNNSLLWATIAVVLVIILFIFFWKIILGALVLLGLFYVVWKIFTSRVKESFDSRPKRLDD
jgi:chromate transport protein ChrA